jgi:hypothetical protein
MNTAMIAVDFTSVVGAVYTAGAGTIFAREAMKQVVKQAIIREALAISVAGGTTFSLSHKVYSNLLNPLIGVEPNWSPSHMIKDVHRDIILFAVLQGVTMKFVPELGKTVSRLSNPVAQTSLEAGTLVGFQQGERVVNNMMEGDTLSQASLEALQKLPDDILYTVAFLLGLKSINFTIQKIAMKSSSKETKEQSETSESTIITYTAEADYVLNAMKKIEGAKVETLENGNIKVVIEGKSVVFEKAKENNKSPEEMIDHLLINHESIPPVIAIQQIRTISPQLLESNSVLAEKVYALREKILLKNKEVFSEQVLTKEGEPTKKLPWADLMLKNTWLPERVEVQKRAYNEMYQEALALSERMPSNPPILILMRGNTAVGKTTVLRNTHNDKYPEIQDLIKEMNILDANGEPTGVINPDAVKGILRNQAKIDGERVTHKQVLHEGAVVTEKVINNMLIEKNSMIVDKRFLKPKNITDISNIAKKQGYKIILIDVDAELHTSLQRVSNRTESGDDPIVPRYEIEKGSQDMKQNRGNIKEIKSIDKYLFIKTD